MSINEGHGHVFPRPDGVKARCGGPGLCHVCGAESLGLGLGVKEQIVISTVAHIFDMKLASLFEGGQACHIERDFHHLLKKIYASRGEEVLDGVLEIRIKHTPKAAIGKPADKKSTPFKHNSHHTQCSWGSCPGDCFEKYR